MQGVTISTYDYSRCAAARAGPNQALRVLGSGLIRDSLRVVDMRDQNLMTCAQLARARHSQALLRLSGLSCMKSCRCKLNWEFGQSTSQGPVADNYE